MPGVMRDPRSRCHSAEGRRPDALPEVRRPASERSSCGRQPRALPLLPWLRPQFLIRCSTTAAADYAAHRRTAASVGPLRTPAVHGCRCGLGAAGRCPPILDRDACLAAMHVIAPNGSITAGFDGFRTIARAVAPLWLTVPFLYPARRRTGGRRIYRYVAVHRRTTCSLPTARRLAKAESARSTKAKAQKRNEGQESKRPEVITAFLPSCLLPSCLPAFLPSCRLRTASLQRCSVQEYPRPQRRHQWRRSRTGLTHRQPVVAARIHEADSADGRRK